MVLKRKRSDSEISCSSSLLSPPPEQSNSMVMDSFQSPQNRISTPSLFSSRTRKRHRDNRPSEEDVHQHTLSMLYTAQRNNHASNVHIPGSSASALPVPVIPSSDKHPARQSSLHSFWRLPPNPRQASPSSIFSNSASTSPLTSSANRAFFEASNCEDCDASLNPTDDGNAMDVDMAMDTTMDGQLSHACTACGKQVCHRCAISNLGADRKCLMCAGSKKQQWVGGLGWMNTN
ncbi:hypothetical protein GLAREA_04291 [Glarea lozoyensis ATCC 20868]|uniref:Uncharacterized protein n=1 Tax=Glarea lozoyensis (strain ATCC 20868 / MF5171) TaxID=1116229 RepID=S3CP61_GLAL2|nr:uncharacterized protein GLAREA_04291 [Glarea lozoyensis ATCC 20868]EPE27500.1 hypothetical protein GLAREA_04291 [Glarea lozoyensis ATCC 20868]